MPCVFPVSLPEKQELFKDYIEKLRDTMNHQPKDSAPILLAKWQAPPKIGVPRASMLSRTSTAKSPFSSMRWVFNTTSPQSQPMNVSKPSKGKYQIRSSTSASAPLSLPVGCAYPLKFITEKHARRSTSIPTQTSKAPCFCPTTTGKR